MLFPMVQLFTHIQLGYITKLVHTVSHWLSGILRYKMDYSYFTHLHTICLHTMMSLWQLDAIHAGNTVQYILFDNYDLKKIYLSKFI